jgi:hypothetical protein
MSLGRLQNRFVALTAAAAFTAVLSSPGEAAADGPVQTWGKGTVGGALLGAEVVVIPMGAAGLNRGWPYFVFGGLGMVGGAVGGYFLDQHFAVSTDAKGNVTGGPATPSMIMLAGGLALVIPAVIVSLNATAYRPPDSDRNEPANNEPAKDAPKPSPGPSPGAIPGEAPPPGSTSSLRGARERPAAYQYRSYRGRVAAMPHIPTSLLDMYPGKMGFGLPAPQVRPLYTQTEMVRYGVSQGTEVQLPVFKAMF